MATGYRLSKELSLLKYQILEFPLLRCTLIHIKQIKQNTEAVQNVTVIHWKLGAGTFEEENFRLSSRSARASAG